MVMGMHLGIPYGTTAWESMLAKALQRSGRMLMKMEQADSLHLKRKWTYSIMILDEDSQRHIQIPSVTLHSRRILRQKCVQENAEELATANL